MPAGTYGVTLKDGTIQLGSGFLPPITLNSGTSFTVQAKPVRQRIRGLPAFVMVRGGGYFFLPGIRATRYLATVGG